MWGNLNLATLIQCEFKDTWEAIYLVKPGMELLHGLFLGFLNGEEVKLLAIYDRAITDIIKPVPFGVHLL